MTLTRGHADTLRADDDLCDFEPSGLWFLDPDPDDDTQEIEVPIVTDDDGETDYDDGRR